jgi:hypothetical protein
MERLHYVYMVRGSLESAGQAAHEWFAEMGAVGADVLKALDLGRGQGPDDAQVMKITPAEANALSHACACALRELTGRAQQTPADRVYRRELIEALAPLSKVVL